MKSKTTHYQKIISSQNRQLNSNFQSNVNNFVIDLSFIHNDDKTHKK